jgi:hypothetical protein
MAEPVGDPVVTPPVEDPAPPDPEPRTFTQEQVDRIVQDRLARAKATPPSDYEELKAAKAELDTLKESQKTELEKAQARAEAAEKERERVAEEAREIKLRSAIVTEAAKPDRKVVDPDLVATLLTPDVEFDDNQNPTNIAEAMDQLLEQRPYLVASDGGARAGSADQGARAGGKKQLTREQLQTMTPAEIVAAQDEGRLDHVMGISS